MKRLRDRDSRIAGLPLAAAGRLLAPRGDWLLAAGEECFDFSLLWLCGDDATVAELSRGRRGSRPRTVLRPRAGVPGALKQAAGPKPSLTFPPKV